MTDTVQATVEVVENDGTHLEVAAEELLTEEQAAEQGLFDGVHDVEVVTVVPDDGGEPVRKVRQRKEYHEATIRPATLMETLANEESLFDDILSSLTDGKPSLDSLYGTVEDLNRVKSTNGLKSISLFSGCGGSETGFALAGWQGLMAVEFVGAARETIAMNYPSSMIEPKDVTTAAEAVIAETGLEIDLKYNKKRKINGVLHEAMINWEETLEEAAKRVKNGADPQVFEDVKRLRYLTSLRVLSERHSDDRVDLWGDDIRALDPDAIMEATGLKRGELDCLEGSPPCKSFSMSGIREDGWGQVLHYSGERNQRTDDLFIEYVRILKGLMPKTFIAENVQGLTVGAAAEDVMKPLLKEFDNMGYRVVARVLNSSDYGVPQTRPRVFFVGVRKDLIRKEDGALSVYHFPPKMAHSYVLQDALDAAASKNTAEEITFATLKTESEIAKIWRRLPIGSAPESKAYQLMRCHPNRPTPTITATSAFNTPAAGPAHPHECRKFTVSEYRYLFGFPTDYKFAGTLGEQGERMGRSVTPYLMKQISGEIAKVIHESEVNGDAF